MTELTFKNVFTHFLNEYWGAFHEALEAQSVTPQRLAGSLFDAVQSAHRKFEEMYIGPAQNALDGLGQIWRDLAARRYQFPDPPFTHGEAMTARLLFEELYDSLIRQGHHFLATRTDVVNHARHGTPKEPLRADAAQ